MTDQKGITVGQDRQPVSDGGEMAAMQRHWAGLIVREGAGLGLSIKAKLMTSTAMVDPRWTP